MPLFRAASAPRSVHHSQQQPPTSYSLSGLGSGGSSGSNVCYGGPLGAILSISAPGSRRGSFRHAASLSSGGGSSLGALASSSYLPQASQPSSSSSYFTPQSGRRQHAAALSKSSESVDSYDSGRGSTQGISSSSDSGAAAGSTFGVGRSRPGSYHGSAAAAASDATGALDYKRLYEKEKANSDRLGAENSRLREENEQLKRQASEQRQVDKRLSEYEAQNRSLEQSLRENEKLKAENRALARVVARLSRQ